MPDKTRMKALQDRAASQSPTGKALRRGDEYDATPQQARDDMARGFGVPVPPPATKKGAA